MENLGNFTEEERDAWQAGEDVIGGSGEMPGKAKKQAKQQANSPKTFSLHFSVSVGDRPEGGIPGMRSLSYFFRRHF